jgi:predicted Zn-dependent protease
MKFVPKRLTETADISRGKREPGDILKMVAGFFLILAAGWVGMGIFARILAETIPDRWEVALQPEIGSGTDDPGLERARLIFHRLTDNESLRNLDYRIGLFPWGEPNAFAVPGGEIGLTPAMINLIDSELGLAFVIAHEIGHHEERHILERLGRGILLNLATTLLFRYDGLSSVGSAMEIAELGFSRRQEREADAFALRLVHRKYGSSDSALEFFQKMGDGETHGSWAAYFSSHPMNQVRIGRLETLGRQLAEEATTPAPR